MAKLLTIAAIERLKPDPRKRREISDAGAPGLHFVIQKSGTRSWAFRYRFDGRPSKLTLGAALTLDDDGLQPVLGGGLTLTGARHLARVAANDVARGIDPADAKKKAQAQPADADRDRDLFKNVVEDFDRRYLANRKSGVETRRLLDKNVLPLWGERTIQKIGKRDVVDLLDGLRDRGMAQGANRVLAAVRKLLNWAVDRDILQASPCIGVKAPVPEVSRDRVLTDDEIRWFWKATGESGFPFGPLFRLLLLTGQRLNEVAQMTHGELSVVDKLWTIPRERMKKDRVHDVPLSDAALSVINALDRIAGERRLLFTTNGKTPVSGFSRAKANLDKAMLDVARRDAFLRSKNLTDERVNAMKPKARAALEKEWSEYVNDEIEIPGWWLHDLRRTTASGMARLRIGETTIEKVLDHISGSLSGVAGVYNRHDYADRKREALVAWGAFVERLVSDAPVTNVVAMRGRST